MTEKEYLICLYAFLPFGPARAKLLISYFESAKKVWNADAHNLISVGIKPITAQKFIHFRNNFNSTEYFNKINRFNVSVLTYKDHGYPENLLHLDNAPLVLYVRGKIPHLRNKSIAVVGSRKMTSYGREVCYKLSFEIARLGVVIVSGLALGIDAVSHQAALDAGGSTIAVLASGVDILTPYTNIKIARAIIEKSGAVISEYPLGTVPNKTFFPNRNRIIAGLSNALLVVEAAIKSGTYHTVNAALGYGRTVFAVPGPITQPTSEFPNYLIKNGARVVTSAQDILDEFTISQNRLMSDNVPELSIKEKKLLDILSGQPLYLDEIARITSWKVSEVSATLTVMELKGIVKNTDSGLYKKI